MALMSTYAVMSKCNCVSFFQTFLHCHSTLSEGAKGKQNLLAKQLMFNKRQGKQRSQTK